MIVKFKFFILAALNALLIARLVCLLGDPSATGTVSSSVALLVKQLPTVPSLPFYTDWRSPIDWIYIASDNILLPIGWLYDALLTAFPQLQGAIPSTWFPDTTLYAITAPLYHLVLNTPAVKGLLPVAKMLLSLKGCLNWFGVIGLGLLALASKLLDILGGWLYQITWTVFTELSFTKKKQAVYQTVLEKRAVELTQLNMQYHNLARETSKLKDTVVTDELTQLFNKRFFIDRMQTTFAAAKAGGKHFALIMVDIDHFKRLNDTYGHLLGDKVLKLVANIVKQSCGSHGFACRFGGEEFSIILPGKTQVEAQHIADLIKGEVPKLRVNEDPGLVVTISQGVFACNFSAPQANSLVTIDDMIKLADDELYRAKLEGRDRVCMNAWG
jgi:diguanylate cyclase (GGDEF)-like protein